MTLSFEEMLSKASQFPFSNAPSVQNDAFATILMVEALELIGLRRRSPRAKSELVEQVEKVLFNPNIWTYLHHNNNAIAPIIPMCFVADRSDVLALALSHLRNPEAESLLSWTDLSNSDRYNSPNSTMVMAQPLGENDPNCAARQQLLLERHLLPQVMTLIEENKWISKDMGSVLQLMVQSSLPFSSKKDWLNLLVERGTDLNVPLNGGGHISEHFCNMSYEYTLNPSDVEFLMDLGMVLPNDGADLKAKNERQSANPTRQAFLSAWQSKIIAQELSPAPLVTQKVKKM